MYENALLSSLPPSQLSQIEPFLTSCRLSPPQMLRKEGDRASDVYFIESGLVSLMSGDRARQIETALIGREGMVGAVSLLGELNAPSTAFVRAEGLAWRITSKHLAAAIENDPDLHRHLLTYVNVRMRDSARAIFAASRCSVEQRVAAWLLSAQDRLLSDELPFTHDLLAAALGVRRPGVTVAIHVLEGSHSITAKRGHITIRSRDILLRTAGSAYWDIPLS